MALFERVFRGSDEMFFKAEAEVDAIIAELGASNRDVLAGVTVNAAKLCGVQAKTGSITEGLAADLVVLDGNPLADISALKNVAGVYQDGRKMF